MIKHDELFNPDSCWNRATDGEMVFVLLGRDADDADTIRFWISKRIARGKNKPDDEQMLDAEQCARVCEQQAANRPDRVA
jgi:hypothetical protein